MKKPKKNRRFISEYAVEGKFYLRSAGFTLFEVLVAAAVFVIVFLTVSAIFVTVINTQRKAIAIQLAQENARYILEYMTKEIRMSTNFNLTGSTLNMINSNGNPVTYQFVDDRIERTEGTQTWPISPDDIKISGGFFLQQSNKRNKITIRMKVETKNVNLPSYKKTMDLQVTVTPRGY